MADILKEIVKSYYAYYESRESIPEGVIAKTGQQHCYAVTSEHLAKTGHMHGKYIKHTIDEELAFKMSRPLDKVEEFNLNGDVRFESLKKRAAELRNSEISGDVHERERHATHAIANDLLKTYENSLDNGESAKYNSAEHQAMYGKTGYVVGEDSQNFSLGSWSNQWLGTKPVQLKDIQEGTLSSRHLAPMLSVLLHEAGIPNKVVVSDALKAQDTELQKLVDGELKVSRAHDRLHMVVITDAGNAVIDPQMKNGEEELYRPIINGTTAEDIVLKGNTAITSTASGQFRFYSGEDIKGENAQSGMNRALDHYFCQNPANAADQVVTTEFERHAHRLGCSTREELVRMLKNLPDQPAQPDEQPSLNSHGLINLRQRSAIECHQK